ncbi:hypothetical protein C0991_010433 [Blastosporella zonata]|nr:hypothetical protein C0991_010433 [Blastosporella zonata]
MGLKHFISQTLGLTKLPPYVPTFLWAFAGFTLVHLVLAPWASRRWFPQAYEGKNKRARNQWAIHIVSQIHALIIVPLSLWVVLTESSSRGADHHARAFGWDDRVGYVHAIACGYFLWDALDAVWNFTDLGFVLHGVACFLIYAMSFVSERFEGEGARMCVGVCADWVCGGVETVCGILWD